MLFICMLLCLKIVTGNKASGRIKQLNCVGCGVRYVNDDMHKQLQMFQCMYGEM